MWTTIKTGLKPLLHIPYGDRFEKTEWGFCSWPCYQPNPCCVSLWFGSSSSGSDFEIDESDSKIVNFWKNTLWRYFKFSQPVIIVYNMKDFFVYRPGMKKNLSPFLEIQLHLAKTIFWMWCLKQSFGKPKRYHVKINLFLLTHMNCVKPEEGYRTWSSS